MAAPGARPPGLSLVHLFRESFTVKMAMIASLRIGRRREVCVVKWVSLRENDFLSRQALTFLCVCVSFSLPGFGGGIVIH